MKTNRRGIMQACDYSLESLKNIKKSLMDLGNNNQELVWAVGGIIVALTSNLLAISQEVFEKSPIQDNPSAFNDLQEIKKRFNEFLDNMINHE